MGIIIMLQGRGWKVSYGQNSRGWWIARKDVHVHWCHWFSSICMKPWLLISRSRMILRVCFSNQILNMSVKRFKSWIARLKPAENSQPTGWAGVDSRRTGFQGVRAFGESLEPLFFKSVGMFGCLVCLFFEDMNAHMQTKWKPVRWGPQAFRVSVWLFWCQIPIGTLTVLEKFSHMFPSWLSGLAEVIILFPWFLLEKPQRFPSRLVPAQASRRARRHTSQPHPPWQPSWPQASKASAWRQRPLRHLSRLCKALGEQLKGHGWMNLCNFDGHIHQIQYILLRYIIYIYIHNYIFIYLYTIYTTDILRYE